MKLKKVLLVLLLQAILVMSLASCGVLPSSGIQSAPPEPSNYEQSPIVSLQPTNTLTPHTFTQDDKILINMIAPDSNINVYDFSVSSDINSVTLWYEEYQNGKLIESGLHSKFDIKQGYEKGSLSVYIDSNELKLTITNGSSVQTDTDHITNVSSLFTGASNYKSNISKLTRNTDIMANSDIPLVIYAVKNGEKITLGSPDSYKNYSSDLKDFDLAYIFICKFSSVAKS